LEVEERVSFYAESSEVIRLEGVLHRPEGAAPGASLAILCHPHPIGGGSMDVPLIVELARELQRRGVAALRFNFRGVGRSSGVSSGGIRETEDVQGVMRWLEERGEPLPASLFLAGWSFGSWVGLRWALQSGMPRRIVLVSPPLVGFDFFAFLDGEPPCPEMGKLIMAGEGDQFSDPARLAELAARLGAELDILPGADHFLFGREQEVARRAASWLAG
jgi:alpha/beta superfamily hydrolase